MSGVGGGAPPVAGGRQPPSTAGGAAVAEDSTETTTYHHAHSTEVCDFLDMSGRTFEGTCSESWVDGHGRTIVQLELQQHGPSEPIEQYAMISIYRADGSVEVVHRAEVEGTLPSWSFTTHANGAPKWAMRAFVYDTAGRRVATNDPDTDSRDPAKDSTNNRWRYRFNRVGDLIAVRDPRGCGQNFFYDRAGRLVGEDYIACDEAQHPDVGRTAYVRPEAIAEGPVGAWSPVDVRHVYDGSTSSNRMGRLGSTFNRGYRAFFNYDDRGNLRIRYRAPALIPQSASIPSTLSGELPQVVTADDNGSAAVVEYDTTAVPVWRVYDYANRPNQIGLPQDPDWAVLGGSGSAPQVRGHLEYDRRGLPTKIWATIDGAPYPIVDSIDYARDRKVKTVTYGGERATTTTTQYDTRRRPSHTETTRGSLPGDGTDEIYTPIDTTYVWDQVNNLVQVSDGRDPSVLESGVKPSDKIIQHDALYRVVGVDFEYQSAPGEWGDDVSRDWRAQRTRANQDGSTHEKKDPMRERPAAMLPNNPAQRIRWLRYRYDYLANMQEWRDGVIEGCAEGGAGCEDEQSAFYERAIGAQIENGSDESGYTPFAVGKRPSALYLSSNLPTSSPSGGDASTDRGGWLWVDYGEGGNVEALTVRARCHDADATTLCYDDTSLSSFENRRDHLVAHCICEAEQHYQYRWDEVNRLAEARRYDRQGSGDWGLGARQRYRYDADNQRIIKQTVDPAPLSGEPAERVALYLFPGDYERRGLVADYVNGEYVADGTLESETQYLIGGARLVWQPGDSLTDPTVPERKHRLTYALTNLIQSTSAVIDLESGDLMELSTFYPNGAMESHWTQDDASMAPEPLGFTGKEEDDELGITYFGERYLIPRIGRWASPDPLAVHAAGGGESLNSYHYVGGDALQARDPDGLEGVVLHGGGPSAGTLPKLTKLVDGIVQRLHEGSSAKPQTHAPHVSYGPPGLNNNPERGVDRAESVVHTRDSRGMPSRTVSPGSYTPAVLAGYSIGGDAALRAGSARGGKKWDLRIVVGARVDYEDQDFVSQLEEAGRSSEAVVVVGIEGDNRLANDPYPQRAAQFVGDFGDRSYEGIVSAVEEKYGSLEEFYEANPNISIQKAPRTAHGGGAEKDATMEAVLDGVEDLSQRGHIDLDDQDISEIESKVDGVPEGSSGAASSN